jgi:hypothetical protein
MTCFVVLAAVCALAAGSASAQQRREQKLNKPSASLSLRPKAAADRCAEYGPGFASIDGTSTCIKIGGSFSVGVGASR